MNRAARRQARAVAKRPATRTVEVELAGDFVGWWALARADFPAGLLVDLSSGELGRVIDALDVIVLEHNLPDVKGELAERMGDVDPYGGLLEISGAIFDAIGKLPNR